MCQSSYRRHDFHLGFYKEHGKSFIDASLVISITFLQRSGEIIKGTIERYNTKVIKDGG